MKSVIQWLDIMKLSIKYWLEGDEWDFAFKYATSIVKGFKS